MPRPRFSELLAERRHQLGLTIEQAARVLKLKEQVLIAFEEGDFASIPKSGYAQGMLSSYARYLGLNAREVVDQFQEDLYEHTNGVMSHELRRRTRASASGRGPLDGREEPRARQASSNSRLPEVSHLLPENPLLGQTDAYDTTSRPRSRTESYRQQASSRASRSMASRSDGAGAGSSVDAGRSPYPQGRPYTGRTTYSAYSRSRNRARQDASAPSRGTYEPGEVMSRSVQPHEYTDDLRVDNSASSYHPASTRAGRTTTRRRSSTPRPQVRRAQEDSHRRQLRNRDYRRGPQRSGFLGFLEVFFSDSRRSIATVIAILVVALIVIMSISIRSCATGTVKDKRTVQVETATSEAASTDAAASTSADKNANTEAATSTNATNAASDANGVAGVGAGSADSSAENVTVTVSVASGGVTWVEITSDGVSAVAETITGPWEKTFNVLDSITMRVGNTTAVSVTKNGQNVQFDELSSGLGTVTIKGSGKTTDDTAADQNGTATNQSATSTSQNGTLNTQNGTSASQNSTGTLQNSAGTSQGSQSSRSTRNN